MALIPEELDMISKKPDLLIQLNELSYCVSNYSKEAESWKSEDEKLSKLREEIESWAPVDEDKIRSEAEQAGYKRGYDEGYDKAQSEA